MGTLHRFSHLNQSSSEFPGQLMNILHDKGYRDQVKSLQDHDSVWLAEYLDEVCFPVILSVSLPKLAQALDILSPISPMLFRKCLVELRAMCGSRGVLPRSYVLQKSPPKTVGWPIASRGPFNVYEGHLDDSKVCVKQLQRYSSTDPETAKHVCSRGRHLPPFPLMIRAGLLSRGRYMETSGAPERRPPPGRYRHSLPIRCGLDAWRRAPGIHQCAPICRPSPARRSPPYYIR